VINNSSIIAVIMNSLSASTGRKKQRTKESKAPVVGRADRKRSSLPKVPSQSVATIAVDDGSTTAPNDVPYVCTGRFAIDFVQLCRRAHLPYVPNVVGRPRRPAVASVVDEKKRSIIGKPSKLALGIQIASSHAAAEQPLSDALEGFIPEPPPKTYVLRDSISFFRPSVQVDLTFHCAL